MSFHIESWVADHSPIEETGPRFLLIMMANQADDEGVLWCKNEYLCARLRKSERTIQRWTKYLEDEGAIVKVHQTAPDGSGRQINNAYRILTPGRSTPEIRSKAPSQCPAVDRVTTLSPSPQEPSFPQASTQNLSPSPRQGCHPLRETIQRNHNGTTTAPPAPPPATPPPKPRTPPPLEEPAAPRPNIAEIDSLSGLGLDAVTIRVTSGRVVGGRQKCLPRGWLSIDDMDRKAVRRALEDTRVDLSRLRQQREGVPT